MYSVNSFKSLVDVSDRNSDFDNDFDSFHLPWLGFVDVFVVHSVIKCLQLLNIFYHDEPEKKFQVWKLVMHFVSLAAFVIRKGMKG